MSNICPYHKIQCKAIEDNENRIAEIKDKMVKKEDLKPMMDAINRKADWKVLALWITVSVTIFTVFASILLYSVRQNNDKVEMVNKSVVTMEANQNILLRAFDIKPVEKPKEVKNE